MSPIKLRTAIYVAWGFWAIIVLGSVSLRYRSISQNVSEPVKSLQSIIPTEFGDWKVTAVGTTLIVNPQIQESLSNTYDETLSRAYENLRNGRILMLSIAYARNQGPATRIHKPEICYPAQGFQITKINDAIFRVADKNISVTTLHARMAARSEYISYWIVLGGTVVRGAIEQNWKRIALAVHGQREEGLLFRVSEITTDESSSYVLQRSFSDELLRAINPQYRSEFVGSITSSKLDDSGAALPPAATVPHNGVNQKQVRGLTNPLIRGTTLRFW